MGYYWTYYAATLLAAFAIRNPWACGVAVLFFAVRRWLPDPVVLMRSLSRIGALKTQARLNAKNAIARRDLGRAYLDLRRPRTALRYLAEATELEPRDADVAYLRGTALLRIGSDEQALRAFAVAVGFDPDENQPFSEPRAARPPRAPPPAEEGRRRRGEGARRRARHVDRAPRFHATQAARLARPRDGGLTRLARARPLVTVAACSIDLLFS